MKTSPVAPESLTPTASLVDKFDRLRDELRAELVERDVEIHLVQVALVAELHLLLYSETPGVAKSQLADRTFLRISGVTYGKFPMHRLMSADDLFGPIDVEAYAMKGRFRRILAGYLGDVDYANLEEIFKAGPATLGLLYSTLNERQIRNDGIMIDVPLRFMISSSNELPKDEISAPLYDRIPLRKEVLPPTDKAAMQRMLEIDLLDADMVQPVLTGADLRQAAAEAARLPFSPAVSEKLTELYFKLAEKGIRPTPRRLNWVRRAMRAEAWLDGSDIVAVEHMAGVAPHALWDLPAQYNDVEAAVLELANPLEKRTMDLLDGVKEIEALLPAAIACDDEEEQQARGMEIYDKIKAASDELDGIVAESGTGRRQRDLTGAARAAVHEVLVEMITKVMHQPIETLQGLGIGKP